MMDHRNFSEKEAAPLLGVSVKTLQLWRHQRKGPNYLKLGRRVLYNRADLEKFISSCRIIIDKGRRGR